MQHTHDLLEIIETLIDAWLTMHHCPTCFFKIAHAAIALVQTLMT